MYDDSTEKAPIRGAELFEVGGKESPDGGWLVSWGFPGEMTLKVGTQMMLSHMACLNKCGVYCALRNISGDDMRLKMREKSESTDHSRSTRGNGMEGEKSNSKFCVFPQRVVSRLVVFTLRRVGAESGYDVVDDRLYFCSCMF